MDPNTCLTELLKYCNSLRGITEAPDPVVAFFETEGAEVELSELLDRIEALDAWIRNGGFLPEPWNVPRTQLRLPGV